MRMTVPILTQKLRTELLPIALATGKRLPSIKELCALYATSPVTALRAVKKLEDENLVRCIRGKGIFANQPSNHSQTRVGVITMSYGIGEPGDEVAFGGFLSDAVARLQRDCQEIVRLQRDDLKGDANDVESILGRLDGVLVTFGCLDDETIPRLRACGKPVVVVQHEHILENPFHQVIPDLGSGYEKVVRLLLAQQIKHVVTATTPIAIHCGRIQSFCDVLAATAEAKSIAVRTIEMEKILTDSGRLTGRLLAQKILNDKEPAGVILCPSDFLAFGIVDVFREANVSLGEEWKLISYDDLESDGLLPFGSPYLTSVVNPRAAISAAAAELLLQQVSTPAQTQAAATHILRIPCGLAERASTGGRE